MKFAIVNTVYAVGSTGTIAKGLYQYLANMGHAVRVFYGRGMKQNDPNVTRIESKVEVYIHVGLARLTGLQGYFSNFATSKMIGSLQQFCPDIVILLNLHGYYLNEGRLLAFLKRKNIKTLYIMLDEYPALGKCCFSNDCIKYQVQCKACVYKQDYPKSLFLDQSKRIFKRKKRLYKDFENISFLGPEVVIKKALQSALIRKKKLGILDWGIDLYDVYQPLNIPGIKEKYNIPLDKKMILSVAKYSDARKGVKRYFRRCAAETSMPDLVFVNVGFDGTEEECPDNFIPIPYVSDQKELAALYACSDLFVLTSIADTMPLAVLISLACGTPICCFDCSGMKYIADNTCAYYVQEGNFEQLLSTIEQVPRKTKEMSLVCRKYAETRYSDKKFYEKILDYAMR